mgnify:CR=1 FL=1
MPGKTPANIHTSRAVIGVTWVVVADAAHAQIYSRQTRRALPRPRLAVSRHVPRPRLPVPRTARRALRSRRRLRRRPRPRPVRGELRAGDQHALPQRRARVLLRRDGAQRRRRAQPARSSTSDATIPNPTASRAGEKRARIRSGPARPSRRRSASLSGREISSRRASEMIRSVSNSRSITARVRSGTLKRRGHSARQRPCAAAAVQDREGSREP